MRVVEHFRREEGEVDGVRNQFGWNGIVEWLYLHNWVTKYNDRS